MGPSVPRVNVCGVSHAQFWIQGVPGGGVAQLGSTLPTPPVLQSLLWLLLIIPAVVSVSLTKASSAYMAPEWRAFLQCTGDAPCVIIPCAALCGILSGGGESILLALHTRAAEFHPH